MSAEWRSRYRALRGLIYWSRRTEARGRALVPKLLSRTRGGRCQWCRLTIYTYVDDKRTDVVRTRAYWHEDCVNAYQIARGYQRSVGLPPGPCAECGSETSLEVDHRDPLVDARESGDRKRILRAYTAANLQWLCADCHKIKTAAEAAARAARRRGESLESNAGQARLFDRK